MDKSLEQKFSYNVFYVSRCAVILQERVGAVSSVVTFLLSWFLDLPGGTGTLQKSQPVDWVWPKPVFANKVLLEPSCNRCIVYGCCHIPQQSWMVVKETAWPIKPIILSVWPIIGKLCWPLDWTSSERKHFTKLTKEPFFSRLLCRSGFWGARSLYMPFLPLVPWKQDSLSRPVRQLRLQGFCVSETRSGRWAQALKRICSFL